MGLAFADFFHELLLGFIVCSRVPYGAAIEGGGYGIGNTKGCINLGYLFYCKSVFHIAKTLASNFLGIGKSNKSQLSCFAVKVYRELGFFISFKNAGKKLFFRKLSSGFLDCQLLFVKFKIHKILLLCAVH